MSPMDEEALRLYAERTSAIRDELLAADPTLPLITAVVMAGDLYSAERATGLMDAGVPFASAVHYVGSYARLDWAIAHGPRDEVLAMLPELWVGSDPDDSKPEYLALWREARAANGDRTVVDGPELPPGPLTVYRGQRPTDPVGIAWSTDRAIAQKFANGASFRTAIEGDVITRTVDAADVLAYLTNRGEAETIIDIERS